MSALSLEFLATSLVVILLPGTGVIYTLAVGLGKGFHASIAAAMGCTLGIVPAALASIVGLAAIFHTSALAFQTVKYLGVVYLLYMAWSILRDRGVLDVSEDTNQTTHFKTAINGTLINVLNPKLSLFFLAFLPQFVDASQANATASMMALASIFMLLTFIVFVGYGACAAMARDRIISQPRTMSWIKRLFAGTFGFLAIRLAFSEK